jgi:4-hydroxy-tetrahydrodipicolinate reductase
MHHKLKKDSPSGTAITLAEKILANCDRKTKIVTQCLDRRIEPEELHVSSTRGGSIPGIHTMYMDSPADTIEITHNARSRGGFALGAVMAAEWIKGKKGFYSVEDFIKEILP